MELRRGQRIDHYTLLELLGEGGQGAVWKVHDPRDGGVVRALKVVSLAETGPAGFERARREARILATAEHPALITCHGLFEDPRANLVGLVMDLVPGCSLADALASGRLVPERTGPVLAQLVDALAYIHGAGLAHRDLKPENVILTDAFWDEPHRVGTVKLVDFGIAVPAGHAAKLTAPGLVVGTLPYLSPEQLDPATWGRSEGPSRDVFAFGVTAYEIRFGRHPTGLGPDAALIDFARAYKAAEAGRIPWPPPGLDGTWGALVAGALTLRPSARPRDGAALLSALRTGVVPKAAEWSGLGAPTSPHAVLTELSPARGSVAQTAPRRTPRTIAAAPAPAAVSPRRARAGSRWGCWSAGAVFMILVVAATAAWLAGAPEPEAPLVVVPAPPPQELPAEPRRTPAGSDLGACCRSEAECNRAVSHFGCPLCKGHPPLLPQRTWLLRISKAGAPSVDEVCAEDARSGRRCVPVSLLPEATGAARPLFVTTDDLRAGRVVFTLRAQGEVVARGPARMRRDVLVTALCIGVRLYLADEHYVTVFLDEG